MGIAEASAVRTAPRIVGDYVLQRRPGSGAMGEVWLGWHQRTEAPARDGVPATTALESTVAAPVSGEPHAG